MASIAQLLEQKAALERQIADAQKEAKSAAIAQVKSLMAEHGLTMADLTARAPAAAPKAKASGGGGKVAVKFRHAATGDTWTGRGLKPKWLKAQLDAGKQLSDFAV
ncbi:MAG: H-NS family nucleoid-associated regulatory protein [Rubrivivax sp.]